MKTIHPSVCSVIPPHLLQRIAEHAEPESCDAARETLQHMNALSVNRAMTFISPMPATSRLEKRRNVYDARQGWTLPGKLVMQEHKRRGSDVQVNEAYDGTGATHDFYVTVLGRNSIDGRGARIDSTVHYGSRFDNAMWTGRQLVFGDGDGRFCNRFTIALDVIAHELTHAVTQNTSGLRYTGETGALNEHLADAFGMMVKQYRLGLTAESSDWLIGAGLLGPAVNGRAIRSMAAPGTAYDDPVLGRDPQPAHMRDYVETAEDNGGVHINSGIPNHAFYLAARALGGETWAVLAQVWHKAATSGLPPDATFADFAQATVIAARELFSAGGRVQTVIAQAWTSVGVLGPAAVTHLPIEAPARAAARPDAPRLRRRPLR
ncbi:MAG TPA: M4 family metallopeptidase [Thermoanaerobaculia bacterium]|nr:M4 family metallopeptidase [Thermoanaerobaculia bacterium]